MFIHNEDHHLRQLQTGESSGPNLHLIFAVEFEVGKKSLDGSRHIVDITLDVIVQ